MATYELIHKQQIPANLDEVWAFIASPHNLKEITPAYMNFVVTSKSDSSIMYPGMIITYKVSPLLNIPLDWCTEITQVTPKRYFVDEQREGPYSMWHHQHILEEIDGGVLMTDIIHYRPPFGVLGRLANTLIIKNQLEKIFLYRFQRIEKLFGSYKPSVK